MAEINTTENLRLWLRTCPSISDVNRFGIDFAGKDPTEYTIYSSPTEISFKVDVTGGLYFTPIQELNYVFACLFPLSLDILQNLENLGFFSGVIDWIYQQNTSKNFPDIAEGRVISIMPTLSPYVIEAGADTGRYQIQLKIKYRRYK